MHYESLERMYDAAPTNQAYTGLKLAISEGQAEICVTATPSLHHTAGATHGSHYFKLLDDAAFFAVNSLVPDVFVLTTQFSIQLFRPVVSGELKAVGTVTKRGRSLFFAEAVLFDANGRELARGHGSFARSTVELQSIPAYVGE